MAVKEGFEPSIRLHVWFLSRELVSATHPPLRDVGLHFTDSPDGVNSFFKEKCIPGDNLN